jgi:WhiB family redox-sensing transcriptional regulator
VTARPDWSADAACLGRDDIDWFPTQANKGGRTRAFQANVDAAKAVCASCTVRSECLAGALAHWGTAGIWGGLTEIERRDMPQARLHALVAECGTDAGYYRHLRQTCTEPCVECRSAHASAQRKRTA